MADPVITSHIQKPFLQPEKTVPSRLYSIDVFRALTMFLMIFVNDLWTLQGIPEWLGHVSADADGMGLADVVFPAFLFIVGLSIPLAIRNRIQRGESFNSIAVHILLRSFALIFMGVLHVNLGYYSSGSLLTKPVWQILITLGFFLVWLDYPQKFSKRKVLGFQSAGILFLLLLLLIFKGGTADNPVWIKPYWWGILGLIGWSYLISSFTYLFIKDKPVALFSSMAFFLFTSSATHLGWLDFLSPIRSYVWIIGDGSMPAMVTAGILVSVLYDKIMINGKIKDFFLLMGLFTIVVILFGFQTRPLWGINKILATPSWTAICIGISIISFAFLIWLVDLKGKRSWFKIIKPAGTSTLTCYLIPYIHYAFLTIVGIKLPIFLKTGMPGIVKCLIYALVIILITGLLEKVKLRLKI
jgi:predicted acyltransferase